MAQMGEDDSELSRLTGRQPRVSDLASTRGLDVV
jgi:hypothetical protein